MGPARGLRLRLRRAGALAGVVLAVAGLVGAACAPGESLAGGGGGVRPRGGCAPGTPMPGAELPPSPTTVVERPATTWPGTPRRPNPIVAVGRDGAVVTLDSRSGERTAELAPAPRSGAVVGVTLSADRTTVWFDVCRRRGPGAIYQVPVDGSAPPRRVATGGYPEASPRADRLAYIAGRSVVVRDLATGTERRWADTGTGRLTGLAWTSNGTGLVWVRGGAQLVRLDVDAPAAQPEALRDAVAGPGEVLFVPLGAGPVYVLAGARLDDTAPDVLIANDDGTVTRIPDGLIGGARDRAVDESLEWLLRTDIHGNLRWGVGGGAGLIASGYVAADW